MIRFVNVLAAAVLANVAALAHAQNPWVPHFTSRMSTIGFHSEAVGLAKVVLLGDSNTEAFWWNIIGGCTAVNAGLGGARVRDVADRAPQLANVLRPRHLHLMIGTNNLPLPTTHEESLSLVADVNRIVDAFLPYGTRIVIWPVPPTAQSQSGTYPSSRRDAINGALATVAATRGLFWDWWWPNTITVNGSTLSGAVASGYAVSGALNADGIHLAAGSQVARYYRVVVWNDHIRTTTGTACN